MAESKRSGASAPVLDDEAIAKREKMLRWIILGVFILIIAGMFAVAGFLSNS